LMFRIALRAYLLRCPQSLLRAHCRQNSTTKTLENLGDLLDAESFGPITLSKGPPELTRNTEPRSYSLLSKDPTEKEYTGALVHGRSLFLPFFHPRTHDIPVASIQFLSYHPRLLDLMTHVATHSASALGIPTSRVIPLPTKRTLWTVPRSPFAHKKSQENFERRVHKRLVKAWDAETEVVERWVQYLSHHAVGGVGIRIVKWNHLPLSIGASQLANEGPERLGDSERIMQLGDEIVKQETEVSPREANGEVGSNMDVKEPLQACTETSQVANLIQGTTQAQFSEEKVTQEEHVQVATSPNETSELKEHGSLLQ